MRINCYRFSGDDRYAKAVNEAMALFHFSREATGAYQISDEHTVHIKVQVFPKGTEFAVITTVLYPGKDKVGCLIKRRLTKVVGDAPDTVIKRLIRLNLLYQMRRVTGLNPGPWGILRGVRPTKIIHRLLDKGLQGKVVIEKVQEDYGISSEKATLITNIALRQRPFLGSSYPEKVVSLYIGIPFCPSRCLYCSFPAFALPETGHVEVFLQALWEDMNAVATLIDQYNLKVETIYLGGGTPTSLSSAHFERLLHEIKTRFITQHVVEFTVEAGRPDSIDDAKVSTIASSGVTRVSVNPQTMQQNTLNRIGRKHTVQDIIDIFGKFRQAGLGTINMDVIAGLPGETEADMEDTMSKIAILKPDNVTVHTLALKRGSLLRSGGIDYSLPDETTTAGMVSIAAAFADQMELKPYYLYRQKYMTGNHENVGYARVGQECLYNIKIMEERQTIIGIGPAAGTKAVDPRTLRLESCYNAKDVSSYLKNLTHYVTERRRLLKNLFESY